MVDVRALHERRQRRVVGGAVPRRKDVRFYPLQQIAEAGKRGINRVLCDHTCRAFLVQQQIEGDSGDRRAGRQRIEGDARPAIEEFAR